MNKKVALLLVVLLLVVGVGTVMAKGGHEKATGSLWMEGNRYVEFNAHETDPAKGELYWWRLMPEGYVRTFTLDIDYVHVEGNEAWFSGIITWQENLGNFDVGDRHCVYVMDSGTPGTDGDVARWGWAEWGPTGDCDPGDAWVEYEIMGGNLVSHTYE